MTPEGFNPKEIARNQVFPLNAGDITRTIGFVEAFDGKGHDILLSERILLDSEDTIFGAVLDDISLLRSSIQYLEDSNSMHSKGVAFAYLLFKEAFRTSNLVLDRAKPIIFLEYFDGLLRGDGQLSKKAYMTLLNMQRGMNKSRVSPSNLLDLLEKKPEGSSNAIDRVCRDFMDNSYEKIASMWSQEPELEKMRDRFNKKFGAHDFDIFTQGFNDFYWPHYYAQKYGPFAEVMAGVDLELL